MLFFHSKTGIHKLLRASNGRGVCVAIDQIGFSFVQCGESLIKGSVSHRMINSSRQMAIGIYRRNIENDNTLCFLDQKITGQQKITEKKGSELFYSLRGRQ